MIDLFSSKELKLQKAQNYKTLHKKPKSLLRAIVQKLFLILISKLFPKKYLTYKNKIKFILNRSGYFFRLFLSSTYLRFRYPLYFKMPSKQIYAVGIAIKFLEILKPKKIDFFLVGGCLLGAVRQESFAGRPTDLDLGIKEDQLPKLLDAIPLLIKKGARYIRTRPYNKLERLQILFPCMLVDIGIYRKKKVGGKVMWGNFGGEMENQHWDRLPENKNIIINHSQNKNLKKKPFTIFLDHLIPIEAYGRKFLAPPNPEIYLEKKYGKDWRIPDKKQFFWNKNKLQQKL
jgi:hypothetical protein